MELTFNPGPKALGAADHLLVVSRKQLFGPRRGADSLRHWLGDDSALARQLGGPLSPGLFGATATSLRGNGKRLTVAALRDATSRHAAASRAEAIRKVVRAADLSPTAKNAVLLVLDDREHVLAAANAVGRALPTFSRRSNHKSSGTVAIACVTSDGKVVSIEPQHQDTIARARQAAHFVDTPPTELDPAAFALAARRLLRPLGVQKLREIRGDALLRQRLAGIHAVGRTARSAPRMLVATFGRGKGSHIALVGKGVTYDTGGLHLKARGHMESMKCDMGGAAAVLGAFAVLARHRPAGRVSLVMCLAENAIGPAAYKPDDVLVMHSGKTVEINNTDAEGRLLLADGCSYAARVLKADIVLDAATLTGAQGVATGELHAAVVSNDADVEAALLSAGQHTGDLCWALPWAPEYYRAEFASPIADMRNSVKNRSNAQVSCAAEFVHWHLEGTKARWGHVDLAAPTFRGDRGTGFGVALLVDAVQRLARAR